jgi:hypothetical protein
MSQSVTEDSPSRHLRNSSMMSLWRRLERQEQTYARRMRQAAEADREAARVGLPAIAKPSYAPLRTGVARFLGYEATRRKRSQTLVAAAITRLREQGYTKFPRPDIVTASREADPEGKGISLSVLYQSAECSLLIAKANGKLEHVPTQIPAGVRRLGRKAIVRRIARLEAAIRQLTTDLTDVNEQIISRHAMRLSHEVSLSLHQNAHHQAPSVGSSGSRSASAVPQRMRTAANDSSPFRTPQSPTAEIVESRRSRRRATSVTSYRQDECPTADHGSLASDHSITASRSGKLSSRSNIPIPGTDEASKITILNIPVGIRSNSAIAAWRAGGAASKHFQRRTPMGTCSDSTHSSRYFITFTQAAAGLAPALRGRKTNPCEIDELIMAEITEVARPLIQPMGPISQTYPSGRRRSRAPALPRSGMAIGEVGRRNVDLITPDDRIPIARPGRRRDVWRTGPRPDAGPQESRDIRQRRASR